MSRALLLTRCPSSAVPASNNPQLKMYLPISLILLAVSGLSYASPVTSPETSPNPASKTAPKFAECDVVVNILQDGETLNRTTCGGLSKAKCAAYAKNVIEGKMNCPCIFKASYYYCFCQITNQGLQGDIQDIFLATGFTTITCAKYGGSLQGQNDF